MAVDPSLAGDAAVATPVATLLAAVLVTLSLNKWKRRRHLCPKLLNERRSMVRVASAPTRDRPAAWSEPLMEGKVQRAMKEEKKTAE
jgi:hypothetical protein